MRTKQCYVFGKIALINITNLLHVTNSLIFTASSCKWHSNKCINTRTVWCTWLPRRPLDADVLKPFNLHSSAYSNLKIYVIIELYDDDDSIMIFSNILKQYFVIQPSYTNCLLYIGL